MSTFHEFTTRQRGHVDRAQLRTAGVSQGQANRLVTAGHLRRPHPGVYLHGSAPPDWRGRVVAACLAAGGDARAMGRTAARLHGLDGAEKHAVIELVVAVARLPAPTDVIVHRTRRLDPVLTTHVGGIPVSSVRQTLLEYASLVPPVLTERAVEDAIRRGLTSEGALRRFLGACGRGVPGVVALRSVLDHRPEGRPARSGFEVVVLDIMREYGLPLPLRRPHVVVPPDSKFELDLAYVPQRIDIEPMGKKWHSTVRQVRQDSERRDALETAGWRIVEVFWDEAIHTPHLVAGRIRRIL